MKQKKYFQRKFLNEINLNDIFSPWEFNLNSNSDISELYNCVLLNFQKNHLQCFIR